MKLMITKTHVQNLYSIKVAIHLDNNQTIFDLLSCRSWRRLQREVSPNLDHAMLRLRGDSDECRIVHGHSRSRQRKLSLLLRKSFSTFGYVKTWLIFTTIKKCLARRDKFCGLTFMLLYFLWNTKRILMKQELTHFVFGAYGH